jgi:hypothetical protein
MIAALELNAEICALNTAPVSVSQGGGPIGSQELTLSIDSVVT